MYYGVNATEVVFHEIFSVPAVHTRHTVHCVHSMSVPGALTRIPCWDQPKL